VDIVGLIVSYCSCTDNVSDIPFRVGPNHPADTSNDPTLDLESRGTSTDTMDTRTWKTLQDTVDSVLGGKESTFVNSTAVAAEYASKHGFPGHKGWSAELISFRTILIIHLSFV
jgi:hypothetical protein